MKKYAIIVAGGSGTRAGGTVPKQLQPLAGKPVFAHAMEAFLNEDPHTSIILVVHRAYADMFRDYVEQMRRSRPFDCAMAEGGATRAGSVLNALGFIREPEGALIAVHDAARPLVSVGMVRRAWEAAALHGAAVPAVPLTDSIRQLTTDGSRSVPRSDYVAVQTPQAFAADIIIGAYRRLSAEEMERVTDDASAVEMHGRCPVLFDGEPTNIKITGPHDLRIAGLILQNL